MKKEFVISIVISAVLGIGVLQLTCRLKSRHGTQPGEVRNLKLEQYFELGLKGCFQR